MIKLWGPWLILDRHIIRIEEIKVIEESEKGSTMFWVDNINVDIQIEFNKIREFIESETFYYRTKSNE